jgi:hypothetical protein
MRAGTLGRDEMRVYAADPAGLLPGEGCGIVVLARSADARAAGLPVYAEIAGWSAVPVSPSSLDGQALLGAYRQAGVDPTDIQLIEGEGTGTAAGDLAELTAFAQLRRGGRATAALGAASAGIGYARAAAGGQPGQDRSGHGGRGNPAGSGMRAAAPADRVRRRAAPAAPPAGALAGRKRGREPRCSRREL